MREMKHSVATQKSPSSVTFQKVDLIKKTDKNNGKVMVITFFITWNAEQQEKHKKSGEILVKNIDRRSFHTISLSRLFQRRQKCKNAKLIRRKEN